MEHYANATWEHGGTTKNIFDKQKAASLFCLKLLKDYGFQGKPHEKRGRCKRSWYSREGWE